MITVMPMLFATTPLDLITVLAILGTLAMDKPAQVNIHSAAFFETKISSCITLPIVT